MVDPMLFLFLVMFLKYKENTRQVSESFTKSIPATKRNAFTSIVPAWFSARQVNQPLSKRVTLVTNRVPLDNTTTFLPELTATFDLYHLMDGVGSPLTVQGNVAVRPLGMVWFLGVCVKNGSAVIIRRWHQKKSSLWKTSTNSIKTVK